MKKFFVILVFIALFSGFSNALSINAESEMVQGPWFFEVNFSSLDDFETADVFVDSQKVYSVIRAPNGFFETDSSSRIINSSLDKSSGRLAVYFSQLGEGTYLIEVESDRDIEEKRVTFFKPVSVGEYESLQRELEDYSKEVSNLLSKIGSLEEENKTLSSLVSDLRNENETLYEQNTNLNLMLENIESKIVELEDEGKTKEEIITVIKDDLQILLDEREEALNNPLTGFFAFGAQHSSLILGVFALVALLVAGLFVKSKTSSIYGSSLFGSDDLVEEKMSEEDDSGISSLNETKIFPGKSFFSKFRKKERTEKPKKKKWATEPYHGSEKKEKDDKRFNLGDLIKKE